MTKRLVLCCDGTWSTPDQEHATNVTKIALAVEPEAGGTVQRVFYQRGVGTSMGERVRGGVFGWGLSQGVQDVYRFVVDNYEPGDEVFLFGFSRGAYMARSTAGLIRSAGILRRENASRIGQAYRLYRDRAIGPRDTESELFRRSFSYPEEPIRFLGVWDTVGSLGIPLGGNPVADLLNKPWEFHDTRLSRSVKAAFQALAIDETRPPFTPTLWTQNPNPGSQVLEQVWFAGSHSDVGGGTADSGLSDVAAGWMAERARSCGLVLTDESFSWPTADGDGRTVPDGFDPDPAGPLHESNTGMMRIFGRAPRTIGSHPAGNECASSTVLVRRQGDPAYRPSNLDRFLSTYPDRVVQVGPWHPQKGAQP